MRTFKPNDRLQDSLQLVFFMKYKSYGALQTLKGAEACGFLGDSAGLLRNAPKKIADGRNLVASIIMVSFAIGS
jgi:hypothetical protein